jgi:hypothetical protein
MLKRHYISILFLLIGINSFGLSFPEVPLMNLIDKSDLIISGIVINTYETDSLILQDFEKFRKLTNRSYYRNTGYTAEIKVQTIIHGSLTKDTILVPYYPSKGYLLPDFSESDTVLLFLKDPKVHEYYDKTEMRYGVKTKYIDLYVQKIKEYNGFIRVPENNIDSLKLNWLIELAITPELTWEGTYTLWSMHDIEFDITSKEKMTSAILSLEKLEQKDELLLEFVSKFDYNLTVTEFCIRNLEMLLDDKYYYLTCGCLMDAIVNMDSRIKYKRLIRRYTKLDYINIDDKKRKELQVISDFIEIVKKHNA